MSITNVKGLPAALVRAIENDPYDSGDSDFTATSLIKPARLATLEERHEHELSEDVEDGLYRLYGQVAHGVLERANADDLAEARYFITVEVGGVKYRVSAQFDTLAIEDMILSDYKFTTSYGFKTSSPPKPEWVAQLNIQLECLRQNRDKLPPAVAEKLDTLRLRIVGLLRDWQKRQAREGGDYPKAPVATVDIPVWQSNQTLAFIKMRIAAHLDAKRELPECSPEERWARPDTWAVVKKGGKRAINGGVQVKEETAHAVAAKNPGTVVQYRPGESVRCGEYCSVESFCTQFQRSKNQTPESGEESA